MLKKDFITSIRKFNPEGKLVEKDSFDFVFSCTGCDDYDSIFSKYSYNKYGRLTEINATEIGHSIEDMMSDFKTIRYIKTSINYDEKSKPTDIIVRYKDDTTGLLREEIIQWFNNSGLQNDTTLEKQFNAFYMKMLKDRDMNCLHHVVEPWMLKNCKISKADRQKLQDRITKDKIDTIVYNKKTIYNNADKPAAEDIYDNSIWDDDIAQSASGSKHILKVYDTSYPYLLKVMISLDNVADTSFADLFRLVAKFDTAKRKMKPGIFVNKNDTLMWCKYDLDTGKNMITKTVCYGYNRSRKFYHAYNYNAQKHLTALLWLGDLSNNKNQCGWNVYECAFYEYNKKGQLYKTIRYPNGWYDGVTCKEDLLSARAWYLAHLPGKGRETEERFYNDDDSLVKILNNETDRTDSTLYIYYYR